MLRSLLCLALYTAMALTANAGQMSADEVAALRDLREGSMRKLVVHDAPRAVSEVSFQTKTGTPVALSDSNGKIRVVNFWATWCAPCRSEKPALDALQASFGGADFEVLALATGRNSLDGIARFNEEVGIQHLETRLDPKSSAARALGILGLPVSVVLDREGREIARLQGGADWNSASSRAIVERLIASGY